MVMSPTDVWEVKRRMTGGGIGKSQNAVVLKLVTILREVAVSEGNDH